MMYRRAHKLRHTAVRRSWNKLQHSVHISGCPPLTQKQSVAEEWSFTKPKYSRSLPQREKGKNFCSCTCICKLVLQNQVHPKCQSPAIFSNSTRDIISVQQFGNEDPHWQVMQVAKRHSHLFLHRMILLNTAMIPLKVTQSSSEQLWECLEGNTDMLYPAAPFQSN